MKTREFLDILNANRDKSLLFEYSNGKFVGANYHITEVKHIHIDSVDCGANSDSWNETLIQLWESPSEAGKTEYMSTLKALGILNKVAKLRAFDPDAELKFEYGNDSFHTAHLFVNDIQADDSRLVVKMAVTKTDCKAKDSCGVPQPAVVEVAEACCSPGSGCC